MTIKVTYNVTDVYVTQDVSPVYINVSYSTGSSGGGAVWGDITGTLSDQTDLQAALDGKFDDPTGDTTQYIAGDGSLVAFPITGQAGTLVREVRNNTGATLTKGTVCYINGASGNRPTVAKAIATSDATSAQTFGLIQADIPNNSNGYLVAFGDLDGLNTSAFAEGVQLYLSATTAGGYTSTKQYAPSHLVYIGVVTRQHVNQGRIEVRIQNGYEMDELHDVAAQTPSNNDGLFYNSTNSLWENKSIATALGYTPANAATTLTINGVTYDLSTSRTWTISAGISGSGASGQVSYWDGTTSQAGSNNLFWDSANGRLGIGTNAPARVLSVTSATNGSAVRIEVPASNSSLYDFYLGNAADSNYIRYNPFILEFNRNGAASTIRTIGSSNDLLLQSSRNLQLAINAGTIAAQLYSTGNLLIQNGGTFTDSGERLQVTGNVKIVGSGSTSGTTGFAVQNSGATNLFKITNDGVLNFGTQYLQLLPTANGSSVSTSGRGLLINSSAGGQAVGVLRLIGSSTITSGSDWGLSVSHTFAPTSGTGIHSCLSIAHTINQTGGANGITRGLYVDATLTSASNYRAIETAIGNIVFGNLPTSSAGLPTGAIWNDAGTLKIV